MIPSVQELVDLSAPVDESLNGEASWDVSTLSTPFHDSYHSLEEMDAFGDELAAKFGPMGIEVEKFSVGQSWEGREIRGWKIRAADDEDEEEKEKVERELVVQSGQHAREVRYPPTASPTQVELADRLAIVGRPGIGAILPASPLA